MAPKSISLTNSTTGDAIPSVGLGLWKVERNIASQVVLEAARSGYRHFDAACDYGNEQEVGEGLQQILASGICQRDELWITSKLWNTYHQAEHVRPALEKTLQDLQQDYLDLYLIHFPIPLKYIAPETRYPPGWFSDPDASHPQMEYAPISVRETWEAMEELVTAGLVKNIGVCNFNCSLLRDLLTYADILPAVLQVESHPYLSQAKLLRFCKESGITFTAYSPLGAPSYVSIGMADASEVIWNEEIIQDIANTYKKTMAQIVLRWGIQRDTAVVPKTSQPERLRENIALFDFELTQNEMNQINSLDRHRRFNDPGVFGEAAFNTFMPIYD